METCPICKSKMMEDKHDDYVDYHCFPSQPDHHYSKRLKGDELAKVKIRLSPEGKRFYLKINYDEGFSQVWTTPDDDAARIRIDHVFQPELHDLRSLNNLLNKIKTYLTFA